MVRPGEGTADTRRLATRTELGESDWELVQRLAGARLVVTDEDPTGQETVEVVHEALIQGWDRLRVWMEADRTFRNWQERLRSAWRRWEASDHDEGVLLRAAPLAEAENWLTDRPDDLSQVEEGYIQASVNLRERRRRRTILGLVAGLIIAALLTIFTFSQTRFVQTQTALAKRQAEEAHSLALSAAAEQALTENKLLLALALVLYGIAALVFDRLPRRT